MSESLAIQGGVERLNNLRILFVSNNKLRDWAEVDRLASLPKLEEVLFAGNPMYNDFKDKSAIPDYRIEVQPWFLVTSPGCFSQGSCLRLRIDWSIVTLDARAHGCGACSIHNE